MNHDLISSFLAGESDMDTNQINLFEANAKASPLLLMCKVRRQYLDDGKINPNDWQRLRLIWNDSFELLQWKQNGYKFKKALHTNEKSKSSDFILYPAHTHNFSNSFDRFDFFIYEIPRGASIESSVEKEVLPTLGLASLDYCFFIPNIPKETAINDDFVRNESNEFLTYFLEDIVTFIVDDDHLQTQSLIDFNSIQHIYIQSTELPSKSNNHNKRDETKNTEEQLKIKMDLEGTKDDHHIAKAKDVEENIKDDSIQTDSISLIKDKNEPLSFTDWLRELPGTTIVIQDPKGNTQTYIKEKKEKHKDKKKKKYKLSPPTENPDQSNFKKKKKKKAKKKKYKDDLERIIESSIEEQEGIVSETLATILTKQGHISKAIEMYDQLILLYPEKSSYFAARINELKKNK
jgi:hypothetical protein